MKILLVSLVVLVVGAVTADTMRPTEIVAHMEEACFDGVERTVVITPNAAPVLVDESYRMSSELTLPPPMQLACSTGGEILLVHCHTSVEAIAGIPTPSVWPDEEGETQTSVDGLLSGNVRDALLLDYLCFTEAAEHDVQVGVRYGIVATQQQRYVEYSPSYDTERELRNRADQQVSVNRGIEDMLQGFMFDANSMRSFRSVQTDRNTGLQQLVDRVSIMYDREYHRYLVDTCPDLERLKPLDALPDCVDTISVFDFAGHVAKQGNVFIQPYQDDRALMVLLPNGNNVAF
jgi:hypothetical protein